MLILLRLVTAWLSTRPAADPDQACRISNQKPQMRWSSGVARLRKVNLASPPAAGHSLQKSP